MLLHLRRALLRASPTVSKVSKYFKSQIPSQGRSSTPGSRRSKGKMATSLDDAQIERMARNFTKWKPVSHQPMAPRQHEIEFSIMTFNILAQENLDNHPIVYQDIKREFLPWEYRRGRIIEQLLRQNCDVLCLQEVQADHLEDFLGPRLAREGYEYVFKCKTGGKNEGCAVFWKKSVFGILNVSQVEFLKPGCRTLNRDNVGLVVTLTPLANRQAKLCVATTHLLFNPKRGDVKLAQLRYLMANVEEAAFLGVSRANGQLIYAPTILCGDLNATPHCPLYRFVVSGKLEVDGLLHGEISGPRTGTVIKPEEVHVGNLLPNTIFEDTFVSRFGEQALDSLQYAFDHNIISHTLGKFQSCYSHTKKGLPEVSTYVDNAETVDYIFFQASRLLRHTATLDLMVKNELDALGSIPNAAMGSDHLPLASRFILKGIPADYLDR
ncbi:protein angel homolog 2 [Galendromus occidentalis]|uniref:Protein angel homolog 2 n=1 Tax=Galendromus occidentalis TaxID=34638 RepID=A0AAJ6QNS8_9ACAR|nr:protein angel homolog 2 [Galendromus occidentalis]